MSETDKDKTIQHLRRTLQQEKLKIKFFKYMLAVPIFIVYRLIFGKRLSRSLIDMREDILRSTESIGRLDIYNIFDSAIKESPIKIYNLAESFILWRLRRGLIIILIASFPTIFLIQQNIIIREQNDLLSRQNEYFDLQTQLLTLQTEDEAISRSIADFKTINRIDYPQIKRIADSFNNLPLSRRIDQLNRLRALYEEGYQRQRSFQDIRNAEAEGNEMIWARSEILKQYECLSVFLLISALMENNFTNAYWVGIYKLDFDNSNFSGADLSNVYLHDHKGTGDFSAATEPPVLCDYPKDEDCG